MDLVNAIKNRRSVRKFSGKTIAKNMLEEVLSAGTLAPSGKNGQPWRFLVIQQDKKLLKKVAALTVYDSFVRTADCLIVILLDKPASYHYVKDCQAVGACIENMLLAITDLGLGSCWIGEILNRDLAVKQLLGLDHRYDLMAVLAVGEPADREAQPVKRELKDCLLGWK